MKYPHLSTHQPVTCGNTRVRCSSRSGNGGRCCSIASKPSVKRALHFLFRGSLRRWRNEKCPERRVMDSAVLLSVRGKLRICKPVATRPLQNHFPCPFRRTRTPCHCLPDRGTGKSCGIGSQSDHKSRERIPHLSGSGQAAGPTFSAFLFHLDAASRSDSIHIPDIIFRRNHGLFQSGHRFPGKMQRGGIFFTCSLKLFQQRISHNIIL